MRFHVSSYLPLVTEITKRFLCPSLDISVWGRGMPTTGDSNRRNGPLGLSKFLVSDHQFLGTLLETTSVCALLMLKRYPSLRYYYSNSDTEVTV